MPDDRLQRTRDTLPRGYQFGQQGHEHVWVFDAQWGAHVCARCGYKRFQHLYFEKANWNTIETPEP